MNSRGALGAETGALPTDFGSALKFELFALFAAAIKKVIIQSF